MISLLRIDDRLIHAQVVIGWGTALQPDRFVIADDRVAGSELEKNLYMAAPPPEFKVSILSIEDTIKQLEGGVFDKEQIFLLVAHPESILRLMDLGLEVDAINVGGLHYTEGKEKVLGNVYLDAGERNALRELVKRGVTLEARSLPDSETVILNSKVV